MLRVLLSYSLSSASQNSDDLRCCLKGGETMMARRMAVLILLGESCLTVGTHRGGAGWR